MPKGFLVKRTKRTASVSYRMREEGSLEQASPVLSFASHTPYSDEKSGQFSDVQPLVCNREIANIPSLTRFRDIAMEHCITPLGTTPPTSPESPPRHPLGERFAQTLRFQTVSSNSPFRAQSFAGPQESSFKSSQSPAAFSASLTEVTTKRGSLSSNGVSPAFRRPTSPTTRLKQKNPKRHDLSSVTPSKKRPLRPDEFGTSPVLGLRIKEFSEVEDSEVKQRLDRSLLLGEIICQLCKERYSDTLTLAQHQCSRIARVEYRCPDCEKVFSCPANLASHRRWHKPRSAQTDTMSLGEDAVKIVRSVAVKNANIQHAFLASAKPSNPCSEGNVTFDCTLCRKKFRRRSYLRKHLAVHSRKKTSLQHDLRATEENDARPNGGVSKHSFHASPGPLSLRRESQAASISANSETYPCRFCGDTFFSSPGLTRHIDKCHSAETGEVVFFPQRV